MVLQPKSGVGPHGYLPSGLLWHYRRGPEPSSPRRCSLWDLREAGASRLLTRPPPPTADLRPPLLCQARRPKASDLGTHTFSTRPNVLVRMGVSVRARVCVLLKAILKFSPVVYPPSHSCANKVWETSFKEAQYKIKSRLT